MIILYIYAYMEVSWNGDYPKTEGFTIKNPISMNDLGVLPF